MKSHVVLTEPVSDRVLAVDIVRGFVMMFIMGASQYGRAFRQIAMPDAPMMPRGHGGGGASLGSYTPDGDWNFFLFLAGQLRHPRWEGLTFYDLIFPTFLFLIGISLVFSLDKIVAQYGKSGAYQRIFKRFALMFVLAMFYDEGLSTWGNPQGEENILCGVMQRLALCYLICSILYMNLPQKGLIGVFLTLMIGYWIMLKFIPVPGIGVNVDSGHCWPHIVDRKIPPYYDTDPEGFSTTLAAACSCLLGVFTASIFKNKELSPMQRCQYFLGGGVALLIVGYVWWYVLGLPVIKRIWTPSYVACAGGYSLLFLAFFYFLADVKQWRGKWTLPFVWVGSNALAIYMVTNMVPFGELAKRIVGGPVAEAAGRYSTLLAVCVGFAMALAFCRALYNRKIFIRL